jgi:hypothetical protein
MIETGRRIPTLDVAQRCDEALETGGTLTRMHRLVAGEAYPAWFRPFVELEKTATSLRSWQPMIVDGLLQTEDYAQAVLRAARPHDRDEVIEQLVTARTDRQAVLLRDDPPRLWVVLDEGVLTRPVGTQAVMAAQLDRLLTAGRYPWVTIQIMPLSAGAHPGLLGPFVIAGFASGPDIAYLDNALTGQASQRQSGANRRTAPATGASAWKWPRTCRASWPCGTRRTRTAPRWCSRPRRSRRSPRPSGPASSAPPPNVHAVPGQRLGSSPRA